MKRLKDEERCWMDARNDNETKIRNEWVKRNIKKLFISGCGDGYWNK